MILVILSVALRVVKALQKTKTSDVETTDVCFGIPFKVAVARVDNYSSTTTSCEHLCASDTNSGDGKCDAVTTVEKHDGEKGWSISAKSPELLCTSSNGIWNTPPGVETLTSLTQALKYMRKFIASCDCQDVQKIFKYNIFSCTAAIGCEKDKCFDSNGKEIIDVGGCPQDGKFYTFDPDPTICCQEVIPPPPCSVSSSHTVVPSHPPYDGCPGETVQVQIQYTTTLAGNYNCGGDPSKCSSLVGSQDCSITGHTCTGDLTDVDCQQTVNGARRIVDKSHTIAESGESKATAGISRQAACTATTGATWDDNTGCNCPSIKPNWNYKGYDSTDLANSCKGGCEAATPTCTISQSTIPQSPYDGCPKDEIDKTTVNNYDCGGSYSNCSSLGSKVQDCQTTGHTCKGDLTNVDCQEITGTEKYEIQAGESKATAGISRQAACTAPTSGGTWGIIKLDGSVGCTCPAAKPYWSYKVYDSADLANSCRGGCSCSEEQLCLAPTTEAKQTRVWVPGTSKCECTADDLLSPAILEWDFDDSPPAPVCVGSCDCITSDDEATQCTNKGGTWDTLETPPCSKSYHDWKAQDAFDCNYDFECWVTDSFCAQAKVCGVRLEEHNCRCLTPYPTRSTFPTSKEQCQHSGKGYWDGTTCVHNTNTNFYWADLYDTCYDFHCDTTATCPSGETLSTIDCKCVCDPGQACCDSNGNIVDATRVSISADCTYWRGVWDGIGNRLDANLSKGSRCCGGQTNTSCNPSEKCCKGSVSIDIDYTNNNPARSINSYTDNCCTRWYGDWSGKSNGDDGHINDCCKDKRTRCTPLPENNANFYVTCFDYLVTDASIPGWASKAANHGSTHCETAYKIAHDKRGTTDNQDCNLINHNAVVLYNCATSNTGKLGANKFIHSLKYKGSKKINACDPSGKATDEVCKFNLDPIP